MAAVKRLIIIVQIIYFLVLRGYWAHSAGRILHMSILNKTDFAVFVSLVCSLLPEDLLSILILSSLPLALCHVAAVKRLPVHHHSAEYIFSGP